jgi:DNA-binding beta-propeller fold protein YncE
MKMPNSKNVFYKCTGFLAWALGAACVIGGSNAHAELFVSVQDGKQMLVDGTIRTAAGEDTLALIEFDRGRASIHAEIPVPTSVIGPPTSVAVTPDGAIALVTAGVRRDPSDPARTLQNDQVSVVDLTSTPPRILDTVVVGQAPAGVSINRAGSLALVANHGDGTVSILSIAGRKVTVSGQVRIGDSGSGPMHVAFTPDGKRALVSRDGDHRVTLLAIDGSAVTVTKRDMYPGQRPDCIDVRAQGDLALVANVGKGQGDADTISLIDLSAAPPRVVHTVSVGQTPESAFFSPDGRHVGVVVIGGSNKPASSPFHNAHGRFVLLRVEGKTLVPVASLPIGTWSQGMAFSADGRSVLVQNAAERQIQVLRIAGNRLVDTGQKLEFQGAPAAIRPIAAVSAQHRLAD